MERVGGCQSQAIIGPPWLLAPLPDRNMVSLCAVLSDAGQLATPGMRSPRWDEEFGRSLRAHRKRANTATKQPARKVGKPVRFQGQEWDRPVKSLGIAGAEAAGLECENSSFIAVFTKMLEEVVTHGMKG